MKDYKANINFFTRWQGLRSIGAGLTIFGICALGMGWVVSYYLFILGMPCFLVGIVLYIYACVGTSTETNILAEIDERKNVLEFPELLDDKSFVRRTPKNKEVFQFENFCYRDGVYAKKLKNGVIASSEYSRTVLHTLTDAFYVKTIRFSLVSDMVENTTVEIPYAALEDITLEQEERELPSGKVTYVVKENCYVFTYDGGTRFVVPAKEDAFAPDIIAKLKKVSGLSAQGQ